MDKNSYMDILKDIVVDTGKSPNKLQEERESNLEFLNEESRRSLSEQPQNINEGVADIFNILFVKLGFGFPKHPKIKAAVRQYKKMTQVCSNTFGDKVSVSSQSGSDTFTNSKKGVKKDKQLTTRTVETNPELGRCLLKIRLTLLRQVVDVIGSEGSEKTCKKNINKSLCIKWVERNLDDVKMELDQYDQILKQSEKNLKAKKLKQII